MNKDKIKFLVILALFFLSLLGATLYRKTDFRFSYKEENSQKQELNSAEYLKYLNSLQVDEVASKRLFQTLVSEEDIRKEVESKLQTRQLVKTVKLDQSRFKVSSSADSSQSVSEYLAKVVAATLDYNADMARYNTELFNKDIKTSDEVKNRNVKYIDSLYSLPVPPELSAMHRSLVSVGVLYGQLIEYSQRYTASQDQKEYWPELYGSYLALDSQIKTFNQELEKTANKYKISELVLPARFIADSEKQEGFQVFPRAKAVLGLGDITITVGDIPRIIKDSVEEGLTASFSQFMGKFLAEMVKRLEDNYLIANFLYYSDALVSGQYVNDYLNKYVEDSLDRQIVKKFIPQFTCGKQDVNLAMVFRAKANEYLGFDPKTVSPSDPEYYKKMSKVGSFLASEEGWKANFEEIAMDARSEAEKAVERELLSSGLKTPRSLQDKSIGLSLSGIVSAQRAGLNAVMQLGVSNAGKFVSGMVAQLTQTLVNQFVFKGVSTSNNSLGVYREQTTCLATAQLAPVIPATLVEYRTPEPPLSEEELLERQCAKLPRGCEGLFQKTQP